MSLRGSALCFRAASPVVLLSPPDGAEWVIWVCIYCILILSYSDDLHLVGSPATVALALKALLQPFPPLETALSLDCHLSAIGLSPYLTGSRQLQFSWEMMSLPAP